MVKPLLSDRQLAAVQAIGRSALRAVVVVKRPVFTAGVLGDDEADMNPQVVSQPSSVLDRGRLLGYLRQTGGDTVGGVDVGRMQTTSTFELALPVGTDIRSRDVVVIRDLPYVVQDVVDDDTWPAMLNCTLRRGT